MPDITGIAHVELSVRDLERSVDWYCALLGARDVWRGSNDEYGIDACAIFEPKSRMVFALTCHRKQIEDDFAPQRPGLDHVSFGVTDRAALEEWVNHLNSTDSASSTARSRTTTSRRASPSRTRTGLRWS
ncbi:MAG: VOC family protein [Dehalococcoidia bacterium]